MEPYLSFADLHQIEGVGNRVPSHRGVFDSRAIEKFKAHSSVNCLHRKQIKKTVKANTHCLTLFSLNFPLTSLLTPSLLA